MKKALTTAILFFWSFYLIANSLPSTLVLQNPIDSFIDLTAHSTIFVDSTAALTFEKIQSTENIQQFTLLEKIQLGERFERGDYHYWLHFKLKNSSAQDSIRLLFKGILVDSISLFIQLPNQEIQKSIAGRWTYGVHNELRFPFATKVEIPISIPSQTELSCWVRLKSQNDFPEKITPFLYNTTYEISKTGNAYLVFFGCMGGFFLILIFLIFFNVVQYFQNRDLAFLFYGLYILSLFFFYLRETSFFNWYFHFIPIEILDHRYYSIAGISIFITYFLFADYFIDAKKKFPKFHEYILWIVRFLIALLLLLQIVTTFDPAMSLEIIYWSRAVMGTITLVVLLAMLRVRDTMMIYFLIGTTLLLLGNIFTFFATALDWFEDSWWDKDQIFAYIGILIELWFFSSVLGYKQLLLKKEKLEIENELVFKKNETQQLKKLGKMKTNFFTRITHEFRTPLTVILGLTKQIKGHQKEKDLILRNSNQLLRLINQILDLNKIEASKMELNWEQRDIMEFIRYCTESLALLAKKKNQSFEVFCFPNHLTTDMDAEKLQKVLSNLLSNAIKFTPNNGKIRLDAYKENGTDQPYLQIDISDSGPGIPREFQEDIFDSYSQLPQTQGGTGLGLSLVKELTILMGGKIQLDSAINKGSTFSLVLPIQNRAPLTANKQPRATTNLSQNESQNVAPILDWTSGNTSILIIEDNEDVQHYLQQFLKSNFNIYTAKNGKEGWEKAKDIRPDIIISDVMMPEMDGYELCQKLKNDEITQAIPVILLTAKASHQDKLEGLKQQADAYLTKPFDEEELLLRIQQLLQKNSILKSRSENIFIKNGLIQKRDAEGVLFMEKLHIVLNENLQNENFKIKTLCSILGMNHVAINNKIKEYTGQTTAQYIRNYRLNFAKELLQTTNYSVAEISYRAGIPEPSNFNNMFKKAFGMSPNQWRKR